MDLISTDACEVLLAVIRSEQALRSGMVLDGCRGEFKNLHPIVGP